MEIRVGINTVGLDKTEVTQQQQQQTLQRIEKPFRKSVKPKVDSLKKSTKLANLYNRLNKKEITKIRNERGALTTEFT